MLGCSRIASHLFAIYISSFLFDSFYLVGGEKVLRDTYAEAQKIKSNCPAISKAEPVKLNGVTGTVVADRSSEMAIGCLFA